MSIERPTADAVGCVAVSLSDPVQGAPVPLHLLYPTRSTAQPERHGPYELALARDAPPDGDRLPLVVISHGSGGSPWVHRDLAVHLARAGFVVALPEHTGNSRADNTLEGTVANLENRPRHLRLAIDAAGADALVGPRLARRGVALIGQSMGGYTALALAGGKPIALANETGGEPRPVAVEHDPRVQALVLITPATVWFLASGSLTDVDAPILLITGDKDPITPPFHAEILRRRLPAPGAVEHRSVANAGHFSFHSPFPPGMVGPDFLPSQDPEGFDRAAYQPILAADVTAFLRRHERREGVSQRPSRG